MKGISTLLLVFGCLAIATQATYLRVIHAVPPGDMRMDVYYTAKDTGEKIRLFQDLNYTDIPPYFFVPVLQDQEQVTLSFLLKESSENISESLFSQQELQGIPSHVVSLRQNFTYTLLVTGASQQPGLTEEQNVTENEDQNEGIQTQDMGLEYLLLSDFNEGDEAPEGMKFVRLINLAEDAMAISLIDAQGECGSNQTEGNQTQEDSGEELQGSGSGNISQPLADQLQYLEATDYLELPMTSEPLDLFVCHQGQKIPITPSPLYRADGSYFSILLFTGASSQGQQNEDLGSESGDLGSESNDSSSQDGMDGDFVAYAVSDEPLTIPNVRIRIVHAESSLPAVNVLVDGQQVFNQVAFGNVTEYTLVVRGIHNISLSPVSRQISQGNQSQELERNSSSLRIITFFAWTKTYTIAVVRTQSGQMGLEEQEQDQQDQEGQGSEESGDMSIEMGEQEEIGGEPTQTAGVTFPGFQGVLHKIFLDDFSENATLGKNYAYVQFVHLASSVGAVNVNIGNQNISNIRFLQSSLYRSIQVNAQRSTTIRVLLASSNTPVFTLNTRLQPGTLYTLWALQDMNRAPRIFLTADRKVQIVCQVMDAEMNFGEQSQESDQ